MHVYSEAARVQDFVDACAAHENGHVSLARLGSLMDASHKSLDERFECSCGELDELVGALRGAGARGARLTGAGWGGCAVALVERDRVAEVLSRVKDSYYSKRIATGELREGDIHKMLFATQPSSGAAIFKC